MTFIQTVYISQRKYNKNKNPFNGFWWLLGYILIMLGFFIIYNLLMRGN